MSGGNLPKPIFYGWKNLGSKLISVCFSANTETSYKEDNVFTCCTTMKWKIQKPVKWTNYIYHYCTLNNHCIMTLFQTLNDLACPNILMSITMATNLPIPILYGWKNLGSKLIFVLLLCKHRNKLQEDNVSTCCTTMKWKIQKPVKWTNYIYHYCTLNNHRIMTIFQTLNDLACPNIVMSIRMAAKRHITVFWVFKYLNKVVWFSPLPCPITCNLLYRYTES